jgi:hypothetical protein
MESSLLRSLGVCSYVLVAALGLTATPEKMEIPTANYIMHEKNLLLDHFIQLVKNARAFCEAPSSNKSTDFRLYV